MGNCNKTMNMTNSKDITVLIPTSPIPSHPSTAILDETIANVRKYTDALIIIMMDGVHSSIAHRTEDYEKYRQAVVVKIALGEYGNCWAKDFEHHTHQAEMTRRTLKQVETPLIMFCEHDTSPIGDIPFYDLCYLIRDSVQFNYVRFNIFDRILDEHKPLMLDENPIVPLPGIKVVRTIQYSQRPHIAKTIWYKSILFDYFAEHDKTMIEDVMHSVVISKYEQVGKDTFGLCIYTPDGSQLRSYHSDGRGDDKKIITG